MTPSTKRAVHIVLTVIWLAGAAWILEVAHADWWWVIVLLALVGLVELLFYRWNEGHWPGTS